MRLLLRLLWACTLPLLAPSPRLGCVLLPAAVFVVPLTVKMIRNACRLG